VYACGVTDDETIWYCPLSQLYFRRECQPASLRMHTDVFVGDVLKVEDLDSHDWGHDIARERWLAGWRP